MAENPFFWSETAADNDDADASVPWPEGMAPGAVNNAARSLMAGVARFIKDMNGSLTTTGSSSAYALTSKCGHTAYANGILIAATMNATNSAGATLNLNTYGAKSIRVFVNGAEAAVAAGQMVTGGTYQFRYDTALNSAAGAWLLLNPSPDPTQLPQIGDVKLWTSDTLPSGSWLWCNGQAVSRTTYASLFTLIGTTYGVGDGSTTFNVPDFRGRSPFGSDDMATSTAGRVTNAGSGIVGTTLGASGGAESVVLAATQIPSHTHSGTTSAQGAHTHTATTEAENSAINVSYLNPASKGATAAAGGTGQIWQGGDISNTSGNSAPHTHGILTTSDPGNHQHTITTDGGTGGGLLHTNMPPALIVNFVIRYAV